MLHFGNRDGANETAVRATPAFGDGAAGFGEGIELRVINSLNRWLPALVSDD